MSSGSLSRQLMTQTSKTTPTFTSTSTSSFSSIRRTFSSSKRLFSHQVPPPETTGHIPRPIPMDIGNSSSASFFQSASSTTSSTTNASSVLSRRFRGNSVFDRYLDPVLNILIYTTAVTLLLHVTYHHLALEEYKISSSKRLKELKENIAKLQEQQVQHTLGGRGEFI
ncbi:hypothetical protein FBU30_010370 [Linnemannia zychae]|nr:hypothetical protein FBU30_010370 [Linnemannia zychae]